MAHRICTKIVQLFSFSFLKMAQSGSWNYVKKAPLPPPISVLDISAGCLEQESVPVVQTCLNPVPLRLAVGGRLGSHRSIYLML